MFYYEVYCRNLLKILKFSNIKFADGIKFDVKI